MVLISDTSMLGNDTPSIDVGLRGLSYVEVEVTGPNRDLHSGVYGGAVANPINILARMIAQMHDDQGRIAIPGFYEKVLDLSETDRTALNTAPFDVQEYKRDLGIDALHGEQGYTTFERTGTRPTLDVNGIWGGYIGEGAKTVLPSKAYAKISMRLVPNQSSEEITALFAEYFRSIAPASVKVEVRPHHGGEPVVTPSDSPEFKAASLAMKETFGKEPIPTRGGGSIPIVALFEQELGLKSVLMGFGLDIDALHSPTKAMAFSISTKASKPFLGFSITMLKSSKAAGLFLTALGCLAFYSCKIAMPSVDFVSFNLNAAGGQVQLRTENPNGFSVTSTRVALQVRYQQIEVGELSNTSPIRFPARQSVVFPLNAQLNTNAMLRAAPNAVVLVLQGKNCPFRCKEKFK